MPQKQQKNKTAKVPGVRYDLMGLLGLFTDVSCLLVPFGHF